MKQTAALILASQSASRKQLLEGAGLKFETLPAHIDEGSIRVRLETRGERPEQIAIELAQAKALNISAKISTQQPQAYIIGADQILELDGEIFEKPGDLAGARLNLRSLRGRIHQLYSAICVAHGGEIVWSHVEAAHMSMRDFDDGFLEDYLSASDPSIYDCVGGYRLEALGPNLFDHIEGDYFTVLGLPLLALLAFMRKISLIN